MRPIFTGLSPPGRGGRLSILIFHRVLAAPDPLFPELPDSTRFDQILRWLKSWMNVVPLDRAVGQLASGTLPSRAAAISFDDGYADNFTHALPLLQRHGLPATFFITTGTLDGETMWNDVVIEAIRDCRRPLLDLEDLGLGRHSLATPAERRIAIDALIDQLKYRPDASRSDLTRRIAANANSPTPASPMMTSADVQQLKSAGMQIGAHTVSHPILTRLAPEDARREIGESKSHLERILGDKVTLFAYPNGKLGEDYNEEHVGIARSIGFDAAVSTNRGAASTGTDLMQLPRFTPWDRDRTRFGARLALNLFRSRGARL